MPSNLQQVVFNACTAATFDSIASKDSNAIYYLTDTHQIYVGADEFTKSVKGLNATPTKSTPGDAGRLYFYDGNLYACGGLVGADYVWTRVANINDVVGSVTSVGAGDGLSVADGSDNPITTSGTLVHAVPSGASTVADSGAAQTPAFGSTFSVQTVGTDKFGHVTSVTDSSVTLPTETEVTVTDGTAGAETLAFGSTFAAITGVAEGTGSHEVVKTATVFTLPAIPEATTYTLASSTEGTVSLVPSVGDTQTVTIDGWSDLAKKSELAAVFKFKGTVATVAALPTTGEVGDVWHVTAANAEYVCVEASTASTDAVWEELGTTIDLSGYMQKVSGATSGNVATFGADGSVVDSGKTIGISVPADAVFTDTTYENATTAVAGLMSTADKIKLDSIEAGGEVNVLEGVQVDGTDLTIDANKKVNITLGSFGITTSASEINQLDNKVSTADNVLTVDGNITGSADSATKDGSGNNIVNTYATKASVSWNVF